MAGLYQIGADPSEGPAPLTVQFTWAGRGSVYAWTFGDEAISYDQNPVHIYQHPGVYEVTLQTWEQTQFQTLNEIESASMTITVTGSDPVVITIGLISPDTGVTVSRALPSGSRITARKKK